MHKSGFVTILGKPNAGKSTLLNAFLERKLVITTPKAQTTRHRVIGILNGDDYQIVFSDTPGVITPKYRLHKAMMGAVKHSLEDAELILLLIDVNEKFSETDLLEMVKKAKTPTILVVNKIDRSQDAKIEARAKEIAEIVNPVETINISALYRGNVDELIQLLIKHLPEGPEYFDKDAISDRPERFFVTEIIREKVFMNLEQEIPYSCEVSIAEFVEEENITRISAEIHVERKSQKGMIIGKRGAMIKKIGTEARLDIEAFLDKKVFIELYVRVSENWKDSSMRLRNFGYEK